MPNVPFLKTIDMTGLSGVGLKASLPDRHFFMTHFFKSLLYRGFLPSSFNDAFVTFL